MSTQALEDTLERDETLLIDEEQVGDGIEVEATCDSCLSDITEENNLNYFFTNPRLNLPSFRRAIHTATMDSITGEGSCVDEEYSIDDITNGIESLHGEMGVDMKSAGVESVEVECSDYEVLCDRCAIDKGVSLEKTFPASIIEPVIVDEETETMTTTTTSNKQVNLDVLVAVPVTLVFVTMTSMIGVFAAIVSSLIFCVGLMALYEAFDRLGDMHE